MSHEGTLRATVTSVSAPNIAALARLLEQGNGSYMVKVHKGRIVSIAKVSRPELIEAHEAGAVELIVKEARQGLDI